CEVITRRTSRLRVMRLKIGRAASHGKEAQICACPDAAASAIRRSARSRPCAPTAHPAKRNVNQQIHVSVRCGTISISSVRALTVARGVDVRRSMRASQVVVMMLMGCGTEQLDE